MRRTRSLSLIRRTGAWVRQAYLQYHARQITAEQLRAVVDQHRSPENDSHHEPRWGIVDDGMPSCDTD